MACVVRDGETLVVFVLLRFEGWERTYASIVNLCDGSPVEDLLRALAHGEAPMVLLYEDDPEPVGAWELYPSAEPWAALLAAVADHGTWTAEEFGRALDAVLSRVRVDQLEPSPKAFDFIMPTVRHPGSVAPAGGLGA
jgi:hypothetical protein